MQSKAVDNVLRPNDFVYLDDNYAKRYRVTRVMKDCIYIIPDFYGANYPRGCSRKVYRAIAIITKSHTGESWMPGHGVPVK